MHRIDLRQYNDLRSIGHERHTCAIERRGHRTRQASADSTRLIVEDKNVEIVR